MSVWPGKHGFLIVVVWLSMLLALYDAASAQPVPGGVCKSVADRTGEVGCWIMARLPVGQLTRSEIFWHLDVYPTRSSGGRGQGSARNSHRLVRQDLVADHRGSRLASLRRRASS